MKRVIRDNGLSIAFALLFVLTLFAQSIAGLADTNEQLTEHGRAPLTWGEFVVSSHFVVDVAENWQSEFLQFFVFILATIWLVQRGSPESKKPGDEGLGSDESQLVGRFAQPDSPAWAQTRGWRLWLFSNSLLIVMGLIFIASWLVQSVAGLIVANGDAAMHGQPALTWLDYVASPEFWNRTLQNWQSEFLAVGAMIVLSIFLRQRGSSESKPVGTPHSTTNEEAE